MLSEIYKILFQQALRIRLVEEKIIELYPTDKIQSPVHLSLGQEGAAVGVCAALNTTDLLFSTYRGHSWYLAKGGDLNTFFAELYGKVTGCCKGKGGSMHLAAPEVGFMGTSAVVASTIPHAIGAAIAARNLGKEQIIIAVFGDGATEAGVFHESLNLASLYKLPIVFVLENNGFAMHTRPSEHQTYLLPQLVTAYGIRYYNNLDSRDFVTIAEFFKTLYFEIKQGNITGPSFIEINTYRWKEHVGPGEDYNVGYRDPLELQNWLANDPLEIDTPLRQQLEPLIKSQIIEAVRFAEYSAFPDREELYKDV